MGFYGNIIQNTNKTQFTFDKTYPNRSMMDMNANSDGIYIGRYVLVDYGIEGEIEPWTQLFINPNTGHFLFAPPDTSGDGEPVYFEETRALYTEDGSKGYYINRGEVIYVEDADGMKSFYMCNGSIKETIDKKDYIFATFEGPISQGSELNSNYTLNYNIDRQKYDPNNSGRGFDSTVWQKVYTDESGEKYVMIAELNSVVPTFDIAFDAPTMEPVVPHFDANSTDIYYRLHLQPQWGLRVRAAKPREAAADEATMKKTGYYDYKPVDYNALNYKWDMESDTKVKTYITKYDPASGRDITSEGNYDGAIYYNKAGFDPAVRSYNTTMEDEISIRPTGTSGQKYTVHKPGDLNPTEGYKIDTQEMVVMLPSLGNTISDLWDLAYGDWDYQRDENGELVLDEKGDKIIVYQDKRNMDVNWGNRYGLRMVKRAPDGNGFEYSPTKVSTLAGCINSVHDLMGAIIMDEHPTIDEALTNHIYYGNFEYDKNDPETADKEFYNSYYIKYPAYVYRPLTDEELEVLKNSNIKQNLTQFEARKYYYEGDNNYYLELSDKYADGINYYLNTDVESLFDQIELVSGFKAKSFYYQNDNLDYMCELNYEPDNKKTYYSITSLALSKITDIDNNKILYNPPEDHEITGEDNDGNTTYTGYFYFDKEKTEIANAAGYPNIKIYTKVTSGMPYSSEYSYFIGVNYTIESEVSVGGEVFETYNFTAVDDSGNINDYGKLTPITFVNFEPEDNEEEGIIADNFYEKVEDTENKVVNYIRLASKEDIKNNIDYYTIKPTEKANPTTPFYQSDVYYYKSEQGDYITATEDDKITGLEYFIKNDNEIYPVVATFYTPHKYYYENPILKGEYILDTNEKMTEGRDYYLREFAFVIEDKRGILQVGSKWNTNITNIPEDEDGERLVILGKQIESWQWKELTGFAKDMNTIHGLIVHLNYKLKSYDIGTRDTNSVQGCINIMNDIINTFGTLVPKEIMIVDEYGRMTSSPHTTDEWIGLEVNDDLLDPMIKVTHEFTPTTNDTHTVDLNADSSNTIELYVPDVDEKGHVVGSDTTTVTLPYGYKTIKVQNSDSVEEASTGIEVDGQIADNTQDTINFNASNKWIKIDNATEDVIKFGHVLSKAESNKQFGLAADTNIEDLNTDNTFEVPNFTLDEAGHVIDAQTHTVTIPENFAKIIVQGSSNQDTDSTSVTGTLEPDSLTDTLTIASGNKWIELKADETNDKFEILHYVKAFNKTSNPDVDYNSSGNTIELQQLSYDKAGHIIGEIGTKYTLPNNYQTVEILNNGIDNVNTLVATNGNLKANTVIDTVTFDTGNRWIQLIADTDNKNVKISHAGAGSAVATAGNTEAQTLEYGGTFTIPYVAYDNIGHITSSNTRVITMPITPAKNLLVDYASLVNENNILNASDTINGALAKLEKNILDNNSSNSTSLSDLDTKVNDNKTAIEDALGQEIDRATAAEEAIKNTIPSIPSRPTTPGYYILQVKDDGTAEWIVFDYTPPVEEETPEEPVV